MSRRSEFQSIYAGLGPLRFWLWLAGTFLFILLAGAALIWLQDKTGWPEAYGLHCRRRCWWDYLAHSDKLLRGGVSRYEVALFALLWLPLIPLPFAAVYRLIKRRRRNPIRPME